MHEAEQHAEYDLLMASQYWPADRMLELQHKRLEVLLRHAKAHVPFYATRLDPLLRANGTIDWDRWSEVPILKRDELYTHRKAMLARAMPAGYGHIGDFTTSGSTGLAVTTSHTSLSLKLSEAAVFRAATWDKLDYSKPLGSWNGPDERVAAWPNGYQTERWGPDWDSRATGGFFEVNNYASVPQVVEFMARHEVRYLTGGSRVRLMAHEVQRQNLTLPLDVVLTRSSVVTQADRDAIARVFGARTIDLYASKENHRIAHECPVSGHWHINDEQMLLEILDSDGQPVAPGQEGRVVITAFGNFAQPLIRHDQGDIAIRGAKCACGRELSMINGISGRVRHMFTMPDGARVVPGLAQHYVAALNATMFQVAQVALDTVEVRYVARNAAVGPDIEVVTAALRTRLRPEINVLFRRVDTFNSPEGKHLEFVSELPA